MNDYMYFVASAMGILGIIAGLIIGYYKSKADLVENYISKKDCNNCSLKGDVANLISDMKTVSEDLKTGSKKFASLCTDIAVIKTRLGVRSDVEELKAMIQQLEKEN